MANFGLFPATNQPLSTIKETGIYEVESRFWKHEIKTDLLLFGHTVSLQPKSPDPWIDTEPKENIPFWSWRARPSSFWYDSLFFPSFFAPKIIRPFALAFFRSWSTLFSALMENLVLHWDNIMAVLYRSKSFDASRYLDKDLKIREWFHGLFSFVVRK